MLRTIMLALLKLNSYCGKKKFIKNITILTTSKTDPKLSDDDDTLQTVSILNSLNVGLHLIGLDFDQLDGRIIDNESQWRMLVSAVTNNSIKTLKQLAFDFLPSVVKPTAIFQGEFRIGADLTTDNFIASQDISCVCFNVEAFYACEQAKVPTKSLLIFDESTGKFKKIKRKIVKSIRLYEEGVAGIDEGFEKIDPKDEDSTELGDTKYATQIVSNNELSLGYRYGKSIVMMLPAIEDQRLYKTRPGIDLQGIIKAKDLPQSYLLSRSTFIIGRKNSEKDIDSLGGLVDALTSLKSYGIARFVKKHNFPVDMVVLIPVYLNKSSKKRKSDDDELIQNKALIMIRLPYLEDERIAVFPKLTSVTTTSGKIIKENHKLLPSEESLDLMEGLIKKMDLDEIDENSNNSMESGDKRIFNYRNLITGELVDKPDKLTIVSPHSIKLNKLMKDSIVKATMSKQGVNKFYSQDDSVPGISDEEFDPKVDLITVTNELEENLKQLSESLNVVKIEKPQKKAPRGTDELWDEENDDGVTLEQLLARVG